MSSKAEKNGVGRTTRKQPPVDYNLDRRAKAIESGNKISPAKANAAEAQVLYIQPKSGESTGAPSTDQSQSIQPQSTPQFNSQEGQPNPDRPNEIAPVEAKDAEMPDVEVERNSSKQPSRSPISVNDKNGPASPAPVGVDESLDEVLVDLRKLSIGRDHDGEPDAWSRLGRSLVFLVRYGPYKAARYRVQIANGYNTHELQKNSKTTLLEEFLYQAPMTDRTAGP